MCPKHPAGDENCIDEIIAALEAGTATVNQQKQALAKLNEYRMFKNYVRAVTLGGMQMLNHKAEFDPKGFDLPKVVLN